MVKFFLLLAILFLSFSLVVLLNLEDHSGNCGTDRVLNTPAFFPKYINIEKREKNAIPPSDTLNQWKLGCTSGYYIRFIPIDLLVLSTVFFGAALWKHRKLRRIL
ncbi:MAG: hypothetical protein US60_C0040G0002 [Microgenomates group bacterium GW2011_GWC1_37_8]|nr:MAG: hypothetical protein US60_C0040G0002 [Microgenomates group bacterium GW2011_GWC1_37_8]